MRHHVCFMFAHSISPTGSQPHQRGGEFNGGSAGAELRILLSARSRDERQSLRHVQLHSLVRKLPFLLSKKKLFFDWNFAVLITLLHQNFSFLIED